MMDIQKVYVHMYVKQDSERNFLHGFGYCSTLCFLLLIFSFSLFVESLAGGIRSL